MLCKFRCSFSASSLSLTTRRLPSHVTRLSLTMLRYFPNPAAELSIPQDAHTDKDAVATRLRVYLHEILKNLQPIPRNVDGGLYVGVSGVAYTLYYLAKLSTTQDQKNDFLRKALNYINPALELKSTESDRTSFLLGDAGNNALAAVIFKDLGDDKYSEYLESYKRLYKMYLHPRFQLKCGGDELFVGRAGYLAGVMWLTKEMQTRVLPYEDLYKICDVIVESGREYSKKHRSPSPLMYAYYKTEYLGAAHGISFILQMLITIPGYLEHNKAAARDIKNSMDFLLSLQNAEGNWPSCMEEVGNPEHKLLHWCHGAPGVIYLMAKAFLVFKEQKYYDSCTKAGNVVWKKGLLKKGPGICHGVAGSGYVFLLLYRLTGDQKYLYRANVFADFLESQEFRHAKTPDNPYSLYEGTAGTVCFLADLLTPEKAEFPFQDVFTKYV